MNVVEAMKERHSVRKYKNKSLDNKTVATLQRK